MALRIALLTVSERALSKSLSGGLGERNNEGTLRSSAGAVCRPTIEWEA